MIDDKIVINNIEVANRVVFQPMEGCDGDAAGGLSDLTIRRYMRFARGGAGVIWFEATAVCSEGRANPRQLMMTENNIYQYKALVAAIKAESQRLHGYEPRIIVQLTHSGRQGNPTGIPAPIVAYRSQFLESGKESLDYIVASDEYCDTIIDKYRDSARLAVMAGFDGADIKCCHGYLLAEFLSAHDRAGRYGGSLSNRVRLYMRCIEAARSVVPEDFILTTRLNATDCYPYPNGYGVDCDGNVDLAECRQIIAMLAERGVELVNITLGNPYLLPHINRPYSRAPESIESGMARVRAIMDSLRGCGCATVMSALTPLAINAVTHGDELIADGLCDMVGYGRMTFAYPEFYASYKSSGAMDSRKLCLLCGKCTELMRAGSVSGCPIRDSEIYLPLYRKYVLKQ